MGGLRPARRVRANLVVLAEVMSAVIVQRHPAGTVRAVGEFGVLRWNGITVAPRATRVDLVRRPSVPAVGRATQRSWRTCSRSGCTTSAHGASVRSWCTNPTNGSSRASTSAFLYRHPCRSLGRPISLPLRHALGQIDGATLFDAAGTLRRIGVRLVPTVRSEGEVDGLAAPATPPGRRYRRGRPERHGHRRERRTDRSRSCGPVG